MPVAGVTLGSGGNIMQVEAHDHYSGLHTTSLFVLAARSRGGLRRQGCIQAASLEPCCQKAAKPLLCSAALGKWARERDLQRVRLTSATVTVQLRVRFHWTVVLCTVWPVISASVNQPAESASTPFNCIYESWRICIITELWDHLLITMFVAHSLTLVPVQLTYISAKMSV